MGFGDFFGGIGSTAYSGLTAAGQYGMGAVGTAGTMALGALPFLGGASQMLAPLLSLMGSSESQQSRAQRHTWEGSMPSVEKTFSQIFNAPWAEGHIAPYGNRGGSTRYSYAPTEATKALYENYLGREYGLSQNQSRAMMAEALGPLRINSLPQGMNTPAQAGRATTLDPKAMAQAVLGAQQPNYLSQKDKLTSAAQIAGYNLWKAQKLGDLIG